MRSSNMIFWKVNTMLATSFGFDYGAFDFE